MFWPVASLLPDNLSEESECKFYQNYSLCQDTLSPCSPSRVHMDLRMDHRYLNDDGTGEVLPPVRL